MWLISLGAVVLCSYFLAKMTANLISMQFETRPGGLIPLAAVTKPLPSEQETQMLEHFRLILERNIFNSKAAGLPTETPTTAEGGGEAHVDLTGEAIVT